MRKNSPSKNMYFTYNDSARIAMSMKPLPYLLPLFQGYWCTYAPSGENILSFFADSRNHIFQDAINWLEDQWQNFVDINVANFD